MASDITMPRLSDSMEEGTILKWLVEEGDEIERGQEIVEIETDKANMTYESDTGGTVIEIVAKEGDTLALGEVIARVGEAGEKPSGGAEEESEEDGEPEAEDGKPSEETAAEEEGGEDGGAAGEERGDGAEEPPGEEEPAREEVAAEGDGAGRVRASPVARRMAGEMGVELARLEGSGPGGRIVKADVEAAAQGDGAAAEVQEAEAAPEEDEAAAEEKRAKKAKKAKAKEKKAKKKAAEEGEAEEAPAAGSKGEVDFHELTRLQRTVSRRMAESKATAPDYALHMEIDMSTCIELRRRLAEISDPAPSYNDMVVKACGMALREFPKVNGAYRDGKFEAYSRVNVGVAVAAQDTLVVPTIFDADRKSLGEISRQARELIGKVREKQVTPPELSGGTFTVSNLGMYGIDNFTAVINPPQAALLAVGALKKKPVVDEDGRVVAKDMMSATLICDHRILYGADGAEFLARIREQLEQPLALAL
jgi:pyruvate dehydrogenase E2 component (dihydrolipoamide acetyltransferase)